MMVRGARARRRVLLGGLITVAVYAAVVCASPLFHHDFECHLKSPSHCPACLAHPAAVNAESGPRLDDARLVPAETVRGLTEAVATAPVAALLKDRSPPA
jgi:hypothetical protein